MQRDLFIAIIGAVIAVLFDVIISPNIAIFSATPNVIIAYTIVLAMLYQEQPLYIIAFVLGMISDLLGFGPVGVSPFLLILACVVVVRISGIFADGTLVVASATIVGNILLFELFYAGFMLALGTGISAIDAITYLAIPCALFDCVLGLILYPIMSHFLETKRSTMGTEPPVARLR